MSVRVTGMEQLQKNIAQAKRNVGAEVFKAINQGAQMVRTTAVKSIERVSFGRRVTRTRASGNTYEHISSRPGDAPNTDTGRLIGSVAVEIGARSAFVGSSVEYAGALEFGEASMAARPWLNPALEANRTEIAKRIERAVFLRALKGVRA